ncbi:MAG: hypothetical protein IKY74_07010 [Alistipes sp.]|nr:hypothetical protein [Alistipes sp.]
MKNSKIILVFALALFLSSCSHHNYLQKTVWVNVSETKTTETPATMITSLEFITDSDVDIYKAVMVDSDVLVKTFKYAEGKYQVNGNPKREAGINITATTLNSDSLIMNGVFRKDEAIIFGQGDENIKAYGKTNIHLP